MRGAARLAAALPPAREHASILAQITAAHLCEHQPYYRLEKQLAPVGVDFPRSYLPTTITQVSSRHLTSTLALTHWKQRGTTIRPRHDDNHRLPGPQARRLHPLPLSRGAVSGPAFRQAFDRLKAVEKRKANARYLRLLELAASSGEDRVADGIGALLRQGERPLADVIAIGLRDPVAVQPQPLAPSIPDLTTYDDLLSEVAV